MPLAATIADIITRLRQGRFQNKLAVCQTECRTGNARCHGNRLRDSLSLPILRELVWDIFGITLVWPEYRTDQGRADFAPSADLTEESAQKREFTHHQRVLNHPELVLVNKTEIMHFLWVQML